jgi:hypothetical protein
VLGYHALHQGQGVHVSFLLSWCGVLIISDLVFLYVEVFFQGEPGIFYVLVVWVLFHLIVACWSEKIFVK